MRPHGSSSERSSRIETTIQDGRVGRHWDKLELIRNSLRPFEQNGEHGENGQAVDIPITLSSSEQRCMVDALTRMGYERDTAVFALRTTKFHSVEAARDYLRQLSVDHANRNANQETRHHSNTTIPIVEGSGQSLIYSNGASNGNLFPSYSSQLDESGSSRSTSPLPHQNPSPSMLSQHSSMPTSSRQDVSRRLMTPVAPDYHRTHLHLSRAPSYNTDYYQQHSRIGLEQRPRPTISIERTDDRPSPGRSQLVTTYKSPLESSISAPAGASQIMLGAPLNSAPYSAHPVIRTVFSSQPRNNTVNINVAPNMNGGGRQFRLDVTGRDGVSSVHGSPGVSGVQSIVVDPEINRAYIGYEDELRPSTSSTPRELYRESAHIPLRPTNDTRSRHSPGQQNISEPVMRSTSPLPEPVATMLKERKYERYVKPCQPRMYCFYMEQHGERMIQQYKERMKRSFQLQREMEAANLPENMKAQMLDFLQQKESKYNRLRRQKMDVSMFDVVRTIGVGAFGRVSLVKKKDTAQVYAMKSLLKKDVIVKQQTAHVKAERDILAEADSLWIVKLFFSFQDDRSLHFVMEYVPGGDMMQLLINKGIFEEKLARFYVAELTCAIEYVHSLGFIHRDIKPDNILIDQQGHVKLTDFGLCTGLRWTHDKRYYGPENDTTPSHLRVDSFSLPADVANMDNNMKVLHVRHQRKRDQAHSVVGTGNYMAPEVIMRIGHTQLCDWWSVGVILYEMVFGRPPFMSERDDPKETQQKICNWSRYLDVSPRVGGGHLSRECITLILMLCRDREDRLGVNGAKQVMTHPWFRGIDFKNLRSTRAEFIPRVEHAEDTSNFDTIEITESPFETLGKRAPLNPAFYEFTFRHFFDTDAQGCPSLRHPQKRPSLAPLMETARHEPTSSTESIII